MSQLDRARPAMVDSSVRTYFQRLMELLLGLQVTDGDGAVLSLEEGSRRAVDAIRAVRAAPGKVMLIGNGGSAAIASHMHNDLCKAVGVRALVFTDVPLLTALSNDDTYGGVFERLVELWALNDDLLVAISSSGRSENVIRAVHAAAARGCRTITLTGFNADNALRRMGHLNFYVAAREYGPVELAHAALAHYLTDAAGELVR